jgi:hypothetical protein
LLKSYSIGDFTKVYPICRGFAPLVATVVSILFLGIAFDFAISKNYPARGEYSGSV